MDDRTSIRQTAVQAGVLEAVGSPRPLLRPAVPRTERRPIASGDARELDGSDGKEWRCARAAGLERAADDGDGDGAARRAEVREEHRRLPADRPDHLQPREA